LPPIPRKSPALDRREIDSLQLTDRYGVATLHDPAIQSLKPKS